MPHFGYSSLVIRRAEHEGAHVGDPEHLHHGALRRPLLAGRRRATSLILGAVAVLAITGCTGDFSASSPTPTATFAPVAGSAAACVGDPAKVVARQNTQSTDAMPDDLAADFDDAAAAVFGQVQVFAPGVIVGVRGPEGTWTKAYGFADLAAETPATPDMHARIASVTKTFVGTAVLQLAEQGRLSLDDPIDDYVPDVPNGSRITLRELITMTSGLGNYSDTPEWNLAVAEDPTAPWTPDELLGLAWGMPPSFAPGSDMEYSNTNFTLLGLVVEQVSGEQLSDVIRTEITEPLELSETAYPTDAALPTPRLNGYTLLATLAPTANPSVTWVDATQWNPSSAGAAGAMTGTVDDLLTWGRVLATGQGVLSSAAQQERLIMGSAHLSAGEFYGQAILCRDGWIGHDGNISGYNTVMRYNSETDTTVVVLASGLDATGTPPRVIVAPEFMSALAEVVGHHFRPTAVPPEAQVQGLVPEL